MSKTIGVVSKLTGCNIETIRFYERINILDMPPRNASGHRVYTEQNIQQLKFIINARNLGFSIEEISELMRLKNQPDTCCASAQALAKVHLDKVRKKLAELNQIEQELGAMYKQCDESSNSCAIIEAMDK
jgi:MerR family transcriptional regulator, mercuric resistance operon regulatory protein